MDGGTQNKLEQLNKIQKYKGNICNNVLDRYNSDIHTKFYKVIETDCYYFPNFFCKKNDRFIFEKIKTELEESELGTMVEWSKHHKHENPENLKIFNKIITEMSELFNVDITQTRLNYYKDQEDWKPFHHDSHAYGNKIENFTMGASFGYSRELVFLHEESKRNFKFPQNNGDLFAFGSETNKLFMHGVPKSQRKVGPRFSIIAWGIRK